MRRFISLWIFDWSTGELADTLRRIGITNPNPNGSRRRVLHALTNKFNAEVSAANQMVAAFHKAVIQQSSGERPYRTIYDNYYGDVTQQGIILDKLFAMQGWVGSLADRQLRPEPGGLVHRLVLRRSATRPTTYVAEDAVDSMIGGQYDVYPYFVPLAVAQFAQDTHSPSFCGDASTSVTGSAGTSFYRLEDFLDSSATSRCRTTYAGCTRHRRPAPTIPRPALGHAQRVLRAGSTRSGSGPTSPTATSGSPFRRSVNTASYVIVRNYTDDVVFQLDDGAFPGGAYGAELPMKYFLDSFNTYN